MGLVRSFQISAVFPHLTVLDNVRVALQRPNGLATQFWKPISALDGLNAKADQLIRSVGLERERNAVAADLFGDFPAEGADLGSHAGGRFFFLEGEFGGGVKVAVEFVEGRVFGIDAGGNLGGRRRGEGGGGEGECDEEGAWHGGAQIT